MRQGGYIEGMKRERNNDKKLRENSGNIILCAATDRSRSSCSAIWDPLIFAPTGKYWDFCMSPTLTLGTTGKTVIPV